MTFYDVAFTFPMHAGSDYPKTLDTIFQDYEALKEEYGIQPNSMTATQAQLIVEKLKALHFSKPMIFDVIVEQYRRDLH